ncbi:MAG: hydrogenase nickel incorporation protein HypB [Deltaproteobacteria bacterium]|nr:hydrogenase nickel incorporation protein HypB [Deltaproteobacteria bacterium]MBW2317187.1 hydrogenase nickel incorporation protein HypB [Deltaproteobacteria bacterium]MBW2600830.1 hydrogenase nickel incorporation protein HypB [Deltaproteobacteria bacterium]
MKIPVVKNILEANERISEENRKLFEKEKVAVINLMSSPGSGKTSLLECTIDAIKDRIRMGVIEGDIQSTRDAERILNKGIPAVQINTDGACHLDSNMIRSALPNFDLSELDLLVVENVGNLVCPAEFALGEDHKVTILSVTEGEDKPEKYPLMFHESSVLLINKIDLLPYIDCDVEYIRDICLKINPKLEIFEISCKTGEGIDGWAEWLLKQIKK